jgi:hypothetical protein
MVTEEDPVAFCGTGIRISKSTSPSWCNIFVMQTGAPNSVLHVTSCVDSSEMHILIDSKRPDMFKC